MTSTLNLSLTFLVVYLLANSFATPLPEPRTHAPATVNLEQSVKEFQTQLQESWQNLTQTSQYIFSRLQQIIRGTVDKGINNLAAWGLDTVLRIEMFTIADGSHYLFPMNSKAELEAEYKATAIALSKLLRNLKTMERADALIKKAAAKLSDENDSDESDMVFEKSLRTLLHEYFQILDDLFSKHPELGDEYRKQLTEAKEVTKQNPKMSGPIFKLGDSNAEIPPCSEIEQFVKGKTILYEVMANKKFLKASTKNVLMIFSQTEHKHFTLARALIQEATSEGHEPKVQDVYQQALTKTRELFLNKRDATNFDIANALFDSLEKSFESSEPMLQKKIQDLIKDVENKTIYDINMFYFDLSFI